MEKIPVKWHSFFVLKFSGVEIVMAAHRCNSRSIFKIIRHRRSTFRQSFLHQDLFKKVASREEFHRGFNFI